MRRLTHVVVVCHQLPPWTLGGLAEYGERFLHHLRATRPNLRVSVHTMPYPHRWPNALKRRLLGRSKGLFVAALLLFHVRTIGALCRGRRKGTVVAVHDWQSVPVGLFAAWVLRLPVVYHVHSDRPDVGDSLDIIGALQRLIGRVARRVVVPTPEMREWLDVRSDTVRVVAHGHRVTPVPVSDPRPVAGFPSDARLLVFAGRLSRVKGVHVLLRALPEVLRRHPDVRLFILGIGFPGTDQDAEVDRLVAELGLAGRVHTYHRYLPKDEVYQHFQAADVCVFPSTFEPFGLVSLEAMALGVPVVLGPGFSRTIASDGVAPTAYRLSETDPVELAHALVSILDDPASAARIAERGRAHVARSFRWTTTVERTVAVYEEALTTRRSNGHATAPAAAAVGRTADGARGPSGLELPATAGSRPAATVPDGPAAARRTAL